jgi:hypothetical protein
MSPTVNTTALIDEPLPVHSGCRLTCSCAEIALSEPRGLDARVDADDDASDQREPSDLLPNRRENSGRPKISGSAAATRCPRAPSRTFRCDEYDALTVTPGQHEQIRQITVR